ncbi:lipase family protein [Orientia chuto str. Dubai]|uniref:Lipase family protein n=1 Tax=Orientia chuto str. Dubai TaxID=1359168 RepID=A0A0F3MJU4_9RICK|nr:hypothetical protein [Candidatus Orientia mediorientalis]KJV56020.1 lipase family protein [Orientia chuto str. Dubai]
MPTKILSTFTKAASLANKVPSCGFAQQAVDLAYKIGRSNYAEKCKKLEQQIGNDGWKVLCTSADYADTNQCGYKAVALINEKTKQVHIATAGTNPTNMHDLRDDLCGVYNHGYISKTKPMQAFLDKITSSVSSHGPISSWDFSTSGHSLGAVVADLTAAEIRCRNLKLSKAITFENPGSKPIVENQYFSNEDRKSILSFAKHCVVVNAQPNFINATNDQLAGEKKLVLWNKKLSNNPDSSASSSNLVKLMHTAARMLGIAQAAEKVASYLGINNLLNDISNHKLANFEDLDESKKENSIVKKIFAVKEWGGKKCILLSDSEAQKLKNVVPTGNDVLVEDKNEALSHNTLQSFACYKGFGYADLLRPIYSSDLAFDQEEMSSETGEGFSILVGNKTDWSTEVD